MSIQTFIIGETRLLISNFFENQSNEGQHLMDLRWKLMGQYDSTDSDLGYEMRREDTERLAYQFNQDFKFSRRAIEEIIHAGYKQVLTFVADSWHLHPTVVVVVIPLESSEENLLPLVEIIERYSGKVWKSITETNSRKIQSLLNKQNKQHSI